MKTCLVTGTTHGIGTETARALAGSGWSVVMACRDIEAAERLARVLRRDTGNAAVQAIECDLAEPDSIRACAEQFLGEHSRLHLLINNAAVFLGPKRRLSRNGIELTFATNHVGPFVLTGALLDILKRSAPARIVNVASAVHRGGSTDFESVTRPEGRSGMAAYATSKLANVLYTFALARRLDGTGVTANCLHPGVVATNLMPGDNALLSWGSRIAGPFMRSPRRGADAILQLATSAAAASVSGRYFDENGRAATASAAARDETLQERLWDFTEDLLQSADR